MALQYDWITNPSTEDFLKDVRNRDWERIYHYFENHPGAVKKAIIENEAVTKSLTEALKYQEGRLNNKENRAAINYVSRRNVLRMGVMGAGGAVIGKVLGDTIDRQMPDEEGINQVPPIPIYLLFLGAVCGALTANFLTEVKAVVSPSHEEELYKLKEVVDSIRKDFTSMAKDTQRPDIGR